jgi:AAA ATPase domain
VLTVHLLGHAHITQNGQPVPLSAKAVALIAYLAAEKLPQHRERLADLLWNTAEARTNLRVELARIRSAGLNIFPASRQLLYLESISTDIDHWEVQQEHEMNQTELSTWLATLRGLPLCGLEDLGSTAFQIWVEQQRWMLCEKVENTLARVYAHYVRSGQEWATRLISSRAEAVGFTDPAEMLTEELISEALPLVRAAHTSGQSGSRSLQHAAASVMASGRAAAQQKSPGTASSGPLLGNVSSFGRRSSDRLPAGQPNMSQSNISQSNIGQPNARLSGPSAGSYGAGSHFARPYEEAQLQQLLSSAEPQIVLLHGPPGSGKTYLAERLAQQVPPSWEVLRLTASRSGRLLLAALAQALLKFAEPEHVLILRQVLLQPGAIEEDMVKVAVALSHIGQPLLLVLDEVHDAPPELTGLLELVCQMPSQMPSQMLSDQTLTPTLSSVGGASHSSSSANSSGAHARFFLLLGRDAPERQVVTRTLLRRLPAIRSLALPPVTLGSVQQVLLARYPEETPRRLQPLASRLTQRSEGNPLHLLSLLGALPDAANIASTDLNGVDLGRTTLPQAVRDTLRSEPEGWSDALRDAMSRLSVINGAFDRLIAQAALNMDRENEVDVLLCEALERQILLEVDPGVALQLPDLSPVRTSPETDIQYMFRHEALRVTLAGQLPQLIRQDVRRRLVTALAVGEPGLASYYAERAGLQEQAGTLWSQYQARLPQDSPLLSQELMGQEAMSQEPAAVPPVLLPPVTEPVRLSVPAVQAVSHQGYTVSLEGGWLNVMSDGRYGHPQTLTLRLSLPQPLTGELRLVWRLDVFGGGEELRPSQNPFPLRLTPVRAQKSAKNSTRGAVAAEKRAAFVFSPQRGGDYREQNLTCRPQPGVELGHWLEHRLSGPEWQGATEVEISVRALDVALTIGVIESEEGNLIAQPAVQHRKLKSRAVTQAG